MLPAASPPAETARSGGHGLNRGLEALARGYLALRGRNTLRYARVLERQQRLPARDLADLSSRRLQWIVRFAYEHVPYYRERFDEWGVSPRAVRSAEDLQRLPTLPREAFRERFGALGAHPPVPGTRQAATGGSTGEPLRFWTTRDVKDWHDAAKVRGWRWAGLELGVRHVLLWGSRFDAKRLGGPAARLERHLGGQLLLDAHVLDRARLERHARRILRFRPRVIHGYAGAVHELARHFEASGLERPTLGAVITTAETLYPHQRRTIERAFSCPVFDRYASRETALEVQECERHEGMHVSIDTAILEIVDEQGQWVAPGETGRMLVTDLTNLAMPFIRYEIGDVATATAHVCSCGRPFPLIEGVRGRASDWVRLKGGRIVHPTFMMYLMYPVPDQDWGAHETEVQGVRQYRITQHDLDSFQVEIVPEPGYGSSDFGYVASNFSRYLGEQVSTAVRLVASIPSGPSGKRRYVRSELAPGPALAADDAAPRRA